MNDVNLTKHFLFISLLSMSELTFHTEDDMSIADAICNIIRDESASEPQLDMTLAEIFDGDVRAFSNAIARIEKMLGVEMCNLKHINRIRASTLEFVLWCLQQPMKKSENGTSLKSTEDLHDRSFMIAAAQLATTTMHSVLLSEEDPLWENPEKSAQRMQLHIEMFDHGFVDIWLFMKRKFMQSRAKPVSSVIEEEPQLPRLAVIE